MRESALLAPLAALIDGSGASIFFALRPLKKEEKIVSKKLRPCSRALYNPNRGRDGLEIIIKME